MKEYFKQDIITGKKEITTYKSKKKANIMTNVIILVLLGIGGILMVIPFLWMLTISFDLDAVATVPFPPSLIPREFTLQNYLGAIKTLHLGRLYINTFMVTVGVIVVSLVSAFMSGYAISKLKFRGWKIVLLICLATMMVPLESTLIPLFLLFQKMGLTNSYMAFYLPAASYAFGTFLVKQYMDTLPDSLREAAIIDGAGEYRIFWSIYLPLSGTLIATLVILQFLANWNNLLWPLIVLNDPTKYTMQIGLAMFKSSVGEVGVSGNPFPAVTMAGTVLSVVPVLIVYLFLQRYIVQSVALSGIKQ